MSTLAAPVVGSPVPLASVAMTLMTQVAREGTAGFWIASGGPKRQFSTGREAPAAAAKPAPPQAVVPAAVVYLRDMAPRVVVVVGAALVDVVVGAALVDVVVGAALVVVVVAAPVVVVAAPVVVVAAPVVVVAAPV